MSSTGQILRADVGRGNISEERVVFAAGPLSGTRAPTLGRFSASFKSPLTGLLTDSNCGGFFGPWIRRAGYDAIVVQGRAEKPLLPSRLLRLRL